MAEFYLNLDFDYDERYDFGKFMNYEAEEYDPLTSKFLRELRNLPLAGRLAVGALENRIDSISYRIYGNVQYWWILLEYNDILYPENIPARTIINYPSVSDLESLYFKLKSLEVAVA